MENNQKTNKSILFIWLVLIILVLAGVYFIVINRSEKLVPVNNNSIEKNIAISTDNDDTAEIILAKFFCQDDRFIDATFNNGNEDSVELLLSDGRNLTLPRAISASGARYANDDESFVFWNKGNTAFIEENDQMTFVDCVTMDDNQDEEKNTEIANPASVNCIKLGGKLEMRTNAKGQYGVCFFEDNRQCEEWALLREQCPVGGLKITGYENEAQAYCVITGGEVEGIGTDSVMCKRVDGTYCQVEANFNGDCPDPSDPNPNSGNVETD